jgi:hypothetical protein
MSGRSTSSRRPQASARDAEAASRGGSSGRRRGPHIGPIGISALRVTLLVALLGGLGFLAYAVFVRDALQVPLMASGFAVIGLVFAAMAILALLSVVRSGRDGRDGMAVMTALVGGLIALASLMSLAAAVIMSLIWSGTKGA